MTASMDHAPLRVLRHASRHAPGRLASISGALFLSGAMAFSPVARAQIALAPSAAASANVATAMAAPGVAAGIVPPPPVREIADPKRPAGQPARLTQAKQQFVNPERAYDPNTGESFYWDCAKKTWFDSKTHVAVGFQGGKTSEGAVIPPPPKLEVADSERVTSEGLMARITQGKQDADNPARAVDPESKQILVWDHRQRSWIDTKTGEAIGFLGRKAVSTCQQAAVPMAPPSQSAILAQADVLDDLLFKEHVPIAPSQSPVISAGMGQALLQLELLLTSKQSVIGGPLRWTAPRAEAKPNPAAQSPNVSSSACLSCGTREPCPSSCPELPTFLQLSKAMLASPL